MSDRLVPQDDRSVDWLVGLIIGGAVVVLAAVIAGLTAALAGWMVPIAVIGLGVAVIVVFGYLFFAGREPVRIDGRPPSQCSRPEE